MINHTRALAQHHSAIRVFSGLICCLWLLIPMTADGKDTFAEEIISIDVKGQPLVEVLEDISNATGYQFSIQENWKEYPVTASIKNEPLYRVLKKLLKSLNNAIIYESDGSIKIMIYGEESISETPGYVPISESAFEPTIHQAVPQLDDQVSEEKSDDEIERPSLQEDSESVSETEQNSDDKAEPEEEIEKIDIEANETIALQENENASLKEADQSEGAELSPEESENSEDVESAKETTTD
jgi:type II secretory pathway component GspD/PulD (secretin)